MDMLMCSLEAVSNSLTSQEEGLPTLRMVRLRKSHGHLWVSRDMEDFQRKVVVPLRWLTKFVRHSHL